MSPGRAFTFFFHLWAALLFTAILWPSAWEVWFGLTFGWLTLSLWDLKLLRRLPPPTMEPQVPHLLTLGAWHDAAFLLTNPGRKSITFDVLVEALDGMEITGLPQKITLQGASWGEIHWALRPNKRGKHYLEPARMALHSPLRFWRQRLQVGKPTVVRVYPNVTVRSRPKQKCDTERHEVFFLLDCGPEMLKADGRLTHLDQCLDAILSLARTAIGVGDAVGLLTFMHYLAPQRGPGTISALLNILYTLQSDTHGTDYRTAATLLLKRLRKHALVIILCKLGAEDIHNIKPALRLLRQRHQVLLVNLCDDRIAFRRRFDILTRQTSTLGLHADPISLPRVLVSRYLAIRRRGNTL